MSEGPKTALKLVGVALAFGTVGVLLYRQRFVSHSSIWHYDSSIFFLPAILALFVNAWIIGVAIPNNWHPGVKGIATCTLAALATFLAFWAYMVVALNTYGE
jgi:hypothetical protein